MTPKEKAKELVDKYRGISATEKIPFMENGKVKQEQWTFYIGIEQSKKCALICAEEILSGGCAITGGLDEAFDKTLYWCEVKTEIEKL